jgi:hypothetical protein
MKKLFTIILILFASVGAYAQADIPSKDSINKIEYENIVIYKDARLDILEKRPALVSKVEEEEKKNQIQNYNPIVSSDGKKKVTGSIYTSKGFRVVIYNGPDRAKAMETKNMFTRAFPNVPSFVSYNVPSYKIKVGNFESRNDASVFMRKVSKVFPTSFIVPDIVTIKNINVSN